MELSCSLVYNFKLVKEIKKKIRFFDNCEINLSFVLLYTQLYVVRCTRVLVLVPKVEPSTPCMPSSIVYLNGRFFLLKPFQSFLGPQSQRADTFELNSKPVAAQSLIALTLT